MLINRIQFQEDYKKANFEDDDVYHLDDPDDDDRNGESSYICFYFRGLGGCLI